MTIQYNVCGMNAIVCLLAPHPVWSPQQMDAMLIGVRLMGMQLLSSSELNPSSPLLFPSHVHPFWATCGSQPPFPALEPDPAQQVCTVQDTMQHEYRALENWPACSSCWSSTDCAPLPLTFPLQGPKFVLWPFLPSILSSQHSFHSELHPSLCFSRPVLSLWSE